MFLYYSTYNMAVKLWAFTIFVFALILFFTFTGVDFVAVSSLVIKVYFIFCFAFFDLQN